jgi:hypothetical protein
MLGGLGVAYRGRAGRVRRRDRQHTYYFLLFLVWYRFDYL